jgi:EmrB/QacA subfamily drug resistance transporter
MPAPRISILSLSFVRVCARFGCFETNTSHHHEDATHPIYRPAAGPVKAPAAPKRSARTINKMPVCRRAHSALLMKNFPAQRLHVASQINHLLLSTALLATFFSGTATRLVGISMPTVAISLSTDLLGVSWALLSYQLSNVGLSIIFGRISDLWGREKVFALGFLVFALSSLFCGLSQTLLQLVLMRFTQGVGGAMLQSSSRALAAESVPENLAGRAQGYMTTAHHVGFVMGPSIGGFMIDYLSWRWSFFFLVPIGLCGSALSLVNLRRRARAATRRPVGVDYPGAVLLFLATSAVVLIFDRSTAQIVGRSAKLLLGVFFFLVLGTFLFHEARAKNPIVNLALFKIRRFSMSVASLMLIAMCYTLTGFLLPFYLQDILGLSATQMGTLFMLPSILTVALAPLSGHLTDRLGPRIPASIGVGFMIVSLAMGVALRPDSHWWVPAALIVVGAITNGIFNPANSTAMIAMTDREHRGFASAVNHVTFGLGNVLGVALGGLFMALAFQRYAGVAESPVSTARPEAFVAAMNTTFFVAMIFSLAGLVTSVIGGRRDPANVQQAGYRG